MKRISLILLCLSAIVLSLAACSKDSDTPLYEHDTIEYDATGANIFRIETVNPYPTDYNECTEVAREELDNGVRPELNGTVENLDDYDVIFVGCPVWWHTAPMAIWSFLESSEYDFSDKIIVPFCTYASTYREETLAKIVELTPDSKHLQGFGTTGRNTGGVENWLRTIHIIR